MILIAFLTATFGAAFTGYYVNKKRYGDAAFCALVTLGAFMRAAAA